MSTLSCFSFTFFPLLCVAAMLIIYHSVICSSKEQKGPVPTLNLKVPILFLTMPSLSQQQLSLSRQCL